MFSNWFRPKNKFSLDNLKYLHSQLTRLQVNNPNHRDQIVEILRSIAELMIWGDQHSENFFEFFAEKSIITYFLKILSEEPAVPITIQLLQTLNILIQNIKSEISIFYLFSNNHINDVIVHHFDFSNEEILSYFISLLKTISLKLNSQTLQFFFNQRASDFPLYTEALQFFNHPELMVRIAVRTLTLNVYRVNDPELLQFFLDSSAVPYFSNLVWFINDQCIQLQDVLFRSSYLPTHSLSQIVDDLIDHFYYIQDILSLDIEELNQVLIDQLLSHLVLPMLIGSLKSLRSYSDIDVIRKSNHNHTLTLSKTLSLFILSNIFSIIQHRSFINSIINCLLSPSPPLLSSFLITDPPQYAVHAHVPLTSILYPSTSLSPLSLSQKCKKDKSYREMKSKEKILLLDENLRPRSTLPPAMVVSPIELLGENFREINRHNPYRSAFFLSLSNEDDHHIYSTLTVLYNIIHNTMIDEKLLIGFHISSTFLIFPECGYYTRKMKRKELLFRKLTSPYDFKIAQNATSKSQPIPSYLSSPSIHQDITNNSLNDTYPSDIVGYLLDILSHRPLYRFITYQMASYLLMDLVVDISPPYLNISHLQKLELIFRQICSDLSSLSDHMADNLFLELFKHVYQTFSTWNHKDVTPKLLNHPNTLLNISSNLQAISGININYRLPNGQVENCTQYLKLYFLLRNLLFFLRDGHISPLPYFNSPIPYNIKEEIQIDSKQDLLYCHLLIQQKKMNVYLLIEQQYILIVEPHPVKIGFAIIHALSPLSDTDIEEYREENKISLHIHYFSTSSLQSTSAAEETIDLYFSNHDNTRQAFIYLWNNRTQLKTSIIHSILSSVDQNQAISLSMPPVASTSSSLSTPNHANSLSNPSNSFPSSLTSPNTNHSHISHSLPSSFHSSPLSIPLSNSLSFNHDGILPQTWSQSVPSSSPPSSSLAVGNQSFSALSLSPAKSSEDFWSKE